MKILFVTFCPIDLNTSAMIRNNALIEGLTSNNHELFLLTIPANQSNPFLDEPIYLNDNRVKVYKTESNNIYISLTSDSSNIIGYFKKKSLPIIRKIYHSINLFDNSIYQAKNIKLDCIPDEHFDLVISSSDPKTSHIAVNNLIKQGLSYGKWLQYWGDPLTLDITNKTLLPKIYRKKIEREMISWANKVVYVSPFTLQKQKELFPEYSNIMHFLPIPYSKEKNSTFSKVDSIRIGYFGDYDSKVRDIMPLYKVCRSEKNKYKLIIAGNSNIELKSSNSIEVIPRVTRNELTKLEDRCNIFICILNKTGTQIPGKLYHYAATNRPVIVIIDGDNKFEMKEYLTKYNRYIICDNNEESIRSAIDKLVKSKKEYKPSPYLTAHNISNELLDLIK